MELLTIAAAVLGALITLLGVRWTNKHAAESVRAQLAHQEQLVQQQLDRQEKTALKHLWWQRKYDAYAEAIQQIGNAMDASRELCDHYHFGETLTDGGVASVNRRLVHAADRLREINSTGSFLMTSRAHFAMQNFIATLAVTEGPSPKDVDTLRDDGIRSINAITEECVRELDGVDNVPAHIRKHS